MSTLLELDVGPNADRLAAPTNVVRGSKRAREFVGPANSPNGSLAVDGEAGPSGSVPRELESARRLVTRAPQSLSALARLATTELGSGNVEEALKVARQVAEAKSADVPAKVLAAQVLIALGHSDAAESSLAVLPQEPGVRQLRAHTALMSGQPEVAMAVLEGTDDIGAHHVRGRACLDLHRYTEAIHHLRCALRENPRLQQARLQLGFAYAALGSLGRAIQHTLEATHLAPSDRTAHFNIVGYHLLAGDADAALQHLRLIQRRHFDDAEVRLAIADVLTRKGEHQKALMELRDIQEHATMSRLGAEDKADIVANIAFLSWRLGRLDRSAAMERIRKQLHLSERPGLAASRILLMLALTNEDPRLSEAREIVSRLSEWYSEDDLREPLTMVRMAEGSYSAALEHSRAWLANDPFSEPAALRTVFLLLEVEQQPEEAARIGEEALRRMPQAAMLRNNVALAWSLAGDPDRGEAHLARVANLELSPFTTATRGALALARGRRDAGNALYRQAIDEARQSGEEMLAQQIQLRHAVLLQQLGFGGPKEVAAYTASAARPAWAVLLSLASRYGIEVQRTRPPE